MSILYESEEDRKRAQALHNQQSRHHFGALFSSVVAGIGLGNVAIGFARKSSMQRDLGWAASVVGLLGFIYNFSKGVKLNKELNKPENANVILEGVAIPPAINKALDTVEAVGLIHTRKGEPLPDDTVIVQGRKAWEEKMAEENAKCGEVTRA